MKLPKWLYSYQKWISAAILWLSYMPSVYIARYQPKPRLVIGAALPTHTFFRRSYKSTVTRAVMDANRDRDMYSLTEKYMLFPEIKFMDEYSPPEILEVVCDILDKKVNTLLYVSNKDYLGEHTASGQYLLQVCNALGIPVIAWNGDNSGFFQVSESYSILWQTL